jgi:glycosyltransferase involved in cell wall biosynthesis
MESGCIRVLHVITGLNTGGAEIMLYRLLSRMDRSRFSNVVISLTGRGKLADAIEKLQVPVVSLEMGTVYGFFGGLKCLIRQLRKYRPHVIQTWLYHADLAGLIAQRFVAKSRLCWNLRCAELSKGDISSSTLALRRVLSLFSGVPDVVMVNSDSGQRAHQALGYRPRRWAVLHNGFDTESCHPDPAARAAMRKELGVSDNVQLVGLIARFDPLKDHANFIRAARLLVAGRPQVRFVLAGHGVDAQNTYLNREIQNANLNGRCYLLSERKDVPRIMAALDLVVSASYSEGFPNTIGEAMACGIPCVATDAGDSAFLIGDTGLIVPPRDSQALARACGMLLDMAAVQRIAMGDAARKRIEQLFSLKVVTDQYQRIYEELGNK